MSFFRLIGAILLAATIVIFGLVRVSFEIIGASTAPDDFALLKQRLPKVLEWLFTTPWPVPTALLILAAAGAAWLFWSGTKKTVADEIADQNGVTEADVKRLVTEAMSSATIDAGTFDPQANVAELQSLVEARLEEFLATKISATFETHAQAHGRDVKLVDLSDRTKAIEQKLDLLTTYAEHTRTDLRETFDNVDYGFAAILNREWHQRLFSELATAYENLAEPVRSGTGIADDAAWQKQVKRWHVDLEQWLVFADYYAMGAKERITKMNDSMYDGQWTFDEAPLNANQVHRYKEVSILWHNAKEDKPRIDKSFEYAAFHAPSKKGRPDAPPRPNEDQ